MHYSRINGVPVRAATEFIVLDGAGNASPFKTAAQAMEFRGTAPDGGAIYRWSKLFRDWVPFIERVLT